MHYMKSTCHTKTDCARAIRQHVIRVDDGYQSTVKVPWKVFFANTSVNITIYDHIMHYVGRIEAYPSDGQVPDCLAIPPTVGLFGLTTVGCEAMWGLPVGTLDGVALGRSPVHLDNL